VTPSKRHNVTVHGPADGQPMMFAHGFGCDQAMWRFVWPAFSEEYRVVLFDHVGYGGSDAAAFDRHRHATLDGYAADVLAICDELGLDDVVFVGHSVSSMIGVLAAAAQPERFARLVLVGPSPRYLDDGDYVGGFSEEDIADLLESLESNYLGWSSAMAPVIMGNPSARSSPGSSRTPSAGRTRRSPPPSRARRSWRQPPGPRAGAHAGARAAGLGRRDRAAAVGEFVHDRLPDSRLVLLSATGHCPNLSAPEETVAGHQDVPGAMTIPEALLDESAEDLFETAPCGYLTTAVDGRFLRVNRTFEEMAGREREDLLGKRRFRTC
jgi:sigma-B regulation protein RsbQ